MTLKARSIRSKPAPVDPMITSLRKEVKEVMSDRKLSGRQFSKVAGVSDRTVTKLLAGDARNMTIETFSAIRRALQELRQPTPAQG